MSRKKLKLSRNSIEEFKIKKYKNDSLTKFEREYIDLYGRLFDMRGRIKASGQIYAILSLRATSPEKGLDQQTIANMMNRSVSTVSRLLTKMVEMKHCAFTEEINPESKRWERRYYTKANFKELLFDRFNQTVVENQFLREGLERIRKRLTSEDINDNRDLMARIKVSIKAAVKMEEFNKLAKEIVEELFGDL